MYTYIHHMCNISSFINFRCTHLSKCSEKYFKSSHVQVASFIDVTCNNSISYYTMIYIYDAAHPYVVSTTVLSDT